MPDSDTIAGVRCAKPVPCCRAIATYVSWPDSMAKAPRPASAARSKRSQLALILGKNRQDRSQLDMSVMQRARLW
ncbi:unnamed protein product [Protopolystoma xenopodis]|uniref:Uncharacterized protein n=1 Tax=Protopolystoma xenopodis TaxID=117903 RepID=A0A448WTU8_9PLAT|nr:unnamed protein product [Protopolystoma xenopodis]